MNVDLRYANSIFHTPHYALIICWENLSVKNCGVLYVFLREIY